MNQIKRKFSRYSLQEWIAFIMGVFLWLVQGYKYATNSLLDWGVELGVFAIAYLLLFFPLTILNFIRKARGLDAK
jgi:hypothetical protein